MVQEIPPSGNWGQQAIWLGVAVSDAHAFDTVPLPHNFATYCFTADYSIFIVLFSVLKWSCKQMPEPVGAPLMVVQTERS